MPSVFVLTGPRCTWLIAKGQVGHRKFSGCYGTQAEAERAARHEGPGWMPVASRPPGVPLQGKKKRKKGRLGQPALSRCLEQCDPVAYAEAKWRHDRGEKVSRVTAARLKRCLSRCRTR